MENEKERKEKARECDKKIFGEYFEKVSLILKKIEQSDPEGFYLEGKLVIGVSKAPKEQPKVVVLGFDSIPFSEIDFTTMF